MKNLILAMFFMVGILNDSKSQVKIYLIREIAIFPDNPTVHDTIFIAYKVSTPKNPAHILSREFHLLNDTLNVKICAWWGQADAGEVIYDTLQYIHLPVGSYHLKLLWQRTNNLSLDSQCINFNRYDDTLITFTVTQFPLSLSEREKDNFALYPNPASNTLTIQLPDITSTVQVKVYNPVGEVVLQQTTNQSNTPINISMLPAGIYFVQVETESGRAVKKLVVE